MYRKRAYRAEELEDLSDDEFEEMWRLTDEQALDSDIGGDDDAEDELPLSILARQKSPTLDQPATLPSDQPHLVPSIQPSSVPSNQPSSPVLSTVSGRSLRGRDKGRGRTRGLQRRQTIASPVNLSRTVSPQPLPPTPMQNISSRPIIRGRGRVRTRGGRRPVVQNQPTFNFKRIYRTPAEYRSFKFKEYSGINVEVDLLNPLKIFYLFFSAQVINNIVTESNHYSTQLNTSLNLFQAELEAFFGILIIMGFHTLPSMRLYWSKNPNYRVNRIANIMPLKRFLKILRYLHINDNTTLKRPGEPGYDRLHKIRPLLDSLSCSYQKAFSPSRYLSIDESMIAFKGRSTLKQYMPNKPTKRGFKVWVICCAFTGYMINMEIYEGKKNGQTEFGLGENVVLHLSSSFVGLGYCLFFDRFFTSILLLKTLLEKKLFACGTIMPSRKFYPSDRIKNDKDLDTGNFDSVMDGAISVTKWMDRGKKSVNIASNLHHPGDMDTVKRTNKEGVKETITCPKIVSDYNRYMGGVDHFDQLMSNYSVAWKSRRWWIKLFYYLLDTAIVNSFIIYKETAKNCSNVKKPMTHLQFRSHLADQLIRDFCSRKQAGRPSLNPLSDYAGHFPEKITLRRCGYCCTKNNYRRSKLGCSVCQVALCAICFGLFHENKCKKINK